jgi:stearoyl-CoA desaturase (delta-9 desaturase)
MSKTYDQDMGINWMAVIPFTIVHVGAVAALFYFSWPAFWTAVFLYWLALCPGIGMCYHRLLTHRSYVVPKWLEYIMAVCGCLALEGGPLNWVTTHRIHHQYSDKDGDPHTPRDGKWWAHIVWMLVGDATRASAEDCRRYSPDLMKDKFLMWLSRNNALPVLALSGVLFLIGGLPFFLWGVCFRITANLHATWMVNSLTHFWGTRRFETRDDSRNNAMVALLSFGEGWHNNHHAHPTSARHGLAWYEFDMSWMMIHLLERMGVASRVRVAAIDAKVLEPKSQPAL